MVSFISNLKTYKQKYTLFIVYILLWEMFKKNMEIVAPDLRLVVTIGCREKKDSEAFIIFYLFIKLSSVHF